MDAVTVCRSANRNRSLSSKVANYSAPHAILTKALEHPSDIAAVLSSRELQKAQLRDWQQAEEEAGNREADQVVQMMSGEDPLKLLPLRFSRLSFSTLPPGLDTLNRSGILQDLSIHDNPVISSLSDDIGALTGLHSIGLWNCTGLSSISSTIGKLDKLSRITLHNCNNLVELPETLGQLPNLTVLTLVGCSGLKSLPQSLGALPKLESLNLRWCEGLGALPKSLADSKTLTTLYLPDSLRRDALPKPIRDIAKMTEVRDSHDYTRAAIIF